VTDDARWLYAKYCLSMVEANIQEWTHGVWSNDPDYQRGSAGPRPDQDSPANYPYDYDDDDSDP
jgi:hypothetical protein